MNTDAIMLFTVPGLFAWIFWVIFSNIRRYKIARVQAESQTKLMEKFGSSQEFIAYMQTEAGKRFLESATIERTRSNPFGRILGAVQAGLILVTIGVGFLFLRNPVPDAAQAFLVFGTLAVALGVGFLLSATASFVLSKSFGLLERASKHRGAEASPLP